MKTFLYKLVYTFLALSMAVFVYAVNKSLSIDRVFDKMGCKDCSVWLSDHIPAVFSYVLYLGVLIGIAFALKHFSRSLTYIDMSEGNVKSIEQASDGMMLTYFGLFFFALSVTNVTALIITFTILLVCVMFSNVYMFNPIFSLILYRFYYITFTNGKKCLLLSRENFEHGDAVKIDRLYKLNEFTYLD